MFPILFDMLNVPPLTVIIGIVDCTPSINFKIADKVSILKTCDFSVFGEMLGTTGN